MTTSDFAELQRLLGDRYDDVLQTACGCDGTRTPHCYACSDSTWDHECPDPVPCEHRAAMRPLAAVLPDLLAERDALAARLAAAEAEAQAQAERAVRAEKQADHETRVAVDLAGIVSGLRAKVFANTFGTRGELIHA